MTNKDFASVLAIAVEKKKLNKSQLVENFIETHKGSTKDDPILDEKNPTPEMVTFAKEFRKKRAKTSDHNLDNFLTVIMTSAPAKAEKQPVKKNVTYRAQEH